MVNKTALIVDDEPDLIDLVSMALQQMKVTTIGAQTLQEARDILKTNKEINFCLTDMQLPDGRGLELVKEIQINQPHIPVAVITAFGNMDTAIESLKAGAFDYVAKPLEIDILRKIVHQASLLNSSMTSAAKSPSSNPEDDLLNQNLIGTSPAMQALKLQIKKVAKSQAPLFIWGESGTGKEVIARSIHQLSSRKEGPFIAVNCGAIPSELIESELFGHKKGSFSGAISDKTGLFAAADGGTLFLDEVADIPLQMQVKLLRVIQEKKLRPVGATQEQTIDCRLLSATHKNLEEQIKQNLFREDLYYRINVIQLSVPPLRTRGNDIIILAQHFLKHICKETHQPLLILSEESTALLQQHSFDGNVRELQNAIQRACALTEGAVITPAHLQLSQPAQPTQPHTQEPVVAQADTSPQPINHATPVASNTMPVYNPDTCGTLEEYLQQIEAQAIKSVLDATHWNRTAAAERLGMTLRSLRYRLKKLGLDE